MCRYFVSTLDKVEAGMAMVMYTGISIFVEHEIFCEEKKSLHDCLTESRLYMCTSLEIEMPKHAKEIFRQT